MLSALLVVKDNLVFSMYEGALLLRTASSNSIGSATVPETFRKRV